MSDFLVRLYYVVVAGGYGLFILLWTVAWIGMGIWLVFFILAEYGREWRDNHRGRS